MRKFMTAFGFLAVAAAIVVASAPVASANCIPAKVAATFDASIALYAYWVPGAAVNEASLRGRFWQQGNRSAGNEGTLDYPGPAGMYFFNGVIYMNANLGDAAVAGCPSVRMLATAQVSTLDGGARYLAATIDEVNGPAADFQFGNLGNLNLVEIPRIQVTSSSRGAGTVTLNFNVPALGGLYGPGAATAVQAIRVLSAAGTADPGRAATSYTTLQDFPTTGGAVSGSVTVDCSNTAVDRFVTTQIIFDQGVGSDLVSRSVRVECDPALADPDREFKLIDKPNIEKPRPGRQR